MTTIIIFTFCFVCAVITKELTKYIQNFQADTKVFWCEIFNKSYLSTLENIHFQSSEMQVWLNFYVSNLSSCLFLQAGFLSLYLSPHNLSLRLYLPVSQIRSHLYSALLAVFSNFRQCRYTPDRFALPTSDVLLHRPTFSKKLDNFVSRQVDLLFLQRFLVVQNIKDTIFWKQFTTSWKDKKSRYKFAPALKNIVLS